MLEALLWSVGIGFTARFLLPGRQLGPLLTTAAGTGGCLLGYLVGHELLRNHELHLFEPESFIPALVGTAMLLVLARSALRDSSKRSLFT